MNDQLSSRLSWREGANYPSPVERVLALGYYDGPTEGVLQCADGQVYRFDLLTWDQETQDLRVFSLSPLPRSAWDQLITLCSSRETPRWPVWVLSWHEELNPYIEDILRQAGPMQWVFATENLQGDILRVKAIRPEELPQVANWGTFLELARELPVRNSPLDNH